MKALACLACALGWLLVSVAGCSSDPTKGYSTSSSFDDSVRTIAVTVFENETFHPGVEADLATALIRRVQRDTPWRVTHSATAETTLRGVIRQVDIRRLTQDTAGGITQQAAVRIVVDFEWRSGTGNLLARRMGLSATESFMPAAGEPLDLGLTAATDELAGVILEAMRSGW